MTVRYIQIADTIRERINSGEYEAEAYLPPYERLSREFSASINTIKASVDILRREGLIDIQHGVGSLVLGPDTITGITEIRAALSEIKQKIRLIEQWIDRIDK